MNLHSKMAPSAPTAKSSLSQILSLVTPHLIADSSARVATSGSGLSSAELPLVDLPTTLAAQAACSAGRCVMLDCCLAAASGATRRPRRASKDLDKCLSFIAAE